MNTTLQKTNYPALYTLIIVFFFWGFMAAGNSIFIPFCKHYFSLDQFQSQLIDFAFYTAYYIGALFLFSFGSRTGKDLINFWGYKKSIVYGLLFSALGAVAMIIAVLSNVYVGMLVGLFIVALGFSLQQTAANPFAMLLGDPKTGNSRINLGGGVNSFGTTIGPLIVAFALFGTLADISDEQIAGLNLHKVVVLYAGVGILFIAAAAIFYFSKKVPAGIQNEPIEKAHKSLRALFILTGLLLCMFVPVFYSYSDSWSMPTIDAELYRIVWLIGALLVIVVGLLYIKFRAKQQAEGWGAMQYPQVILGMLAIFTYVGVEVAIGSNLGELLRQEEFGAYSSSQIAPFISMYWGSLMIGRWAGAVHAFNLNKPIKTIALIVAPLIAYTVVIGVNILSGKDMSVLYFYIVCVCIQIVAMLACRNKPATTLLVFALLGIVAMLIGLATTGTVAVYAFLAGGLCCSIMWPSIFSLSITGLGKYTSQGSAFLIMMILGGGIIPPIQGKLADMIGIHHSYIVAVACFAFLAFFAVAVKKILLQQKIDVDTIENN